jgi:hypothetical protein
VRNGLVDCQPPTIQGVYVYGNSGEFFVGHVFCKMTNVNNQVMVCVLCVFILCVLFCMGACAVAIGISDLKCDSADSDCKEFELPETKEEDKKR